MENRRNNLKKRISEANKQITSNAPIRSSNLVGISLLEPADDTSDDGEKNSLRSNNLTQAKGLSYGTNLSDKIHYKYLSEKENNEPALRSQANSMQYQRRDVLRLNPDVSNNLDAAQTERPPTDRRKSIQSVAHVSERELRMEPKDRKESHKIFSTEMKM